MTEIVVSAIAAAGFILVVFLWIFHMGTVRRLKKHQAEWNKKKKTAIENGLSDDQIDWLYLSYIEHLFENRSRFFGACFPRK